MDSKLIPQDENGMLKAQLETTEGLLAYCVALKHFAQINDEHVDAIQTQIFKVMAGVGINVDAIQQHIDRLVQQGGKSLKEEFGNQGVDQSDRSRTYPGDAQLATTPTNSITSQFAVMDTKQQSSNKKRRPTETNASVPQPPIPLISNGTAHNTLFGQPHNNSFNANNIDNNPNHNGNNNNNISPFGQVGATNRGRSQRGNPGGRNMRRTGTNGGAVQNFGMVVPHMQYGGMPVPTMQHFGMGGPNIHYGGMAAWVLMLSYC